MRRMECGSCGCTIHFHISKDPYGEADKVVEDPERFFYCPVCSSAEPSVEEVSLASKN